MYTLKSGSHMPPTYLGRSRRHGLRKRCGICEHFYRRHIICPRHWPPAYLRSWAEFSFASKKAVVGDCRRWKYFMRTSSAVAAFFINTIRSRFRGKMVENCPIRFTFRTNFSMSATHRRCAGDPLGQVAERYQLQPATTSQVGRRDMRTRLKGISPCDKSLRLVP